MSNFGLALQGLGEGFAGRGQQWRQAQAEKEIAAIKAHQERERQIKQTLLGDSRAVMMLGGEGRWDLAEKRLVGRLGDLQKLGRNSSQTEQMLAMVRDPSQHQGLLSELQSLDRVMVANGKLEPLPVTEKKEGWTNVTKDAAGHSWGIPANNPNAGYQRIPVGEGYATEAPETPADNQPKIDKLRGEVSKLGKAYRDVERSYSKLDKSLKAKTAAGDLSAIFAYMKMIDPGSTVREGEMATAEQARGVPSGILNLYNKAVAGERLTEEQRADFSARGAEMFQSERHAYDTNINNVLQLADEDGLTRQSVLGKQRLADFEERWSTRQSNDPLGIR